MHFEVSMSYAQKTGPKVCHGKKKRERLFPLGHGQPALESQNGHGALDLQNENALEGCFTSVPMSSTTELYT